MPILLTKPFSVGDLDPDAGEGYKFCQLTGLYHNGLTMSITLEWQFGTASGAYYQNWQRGAGSPTKSCDVPGSQVVPLWSQMPKEGESVGEAIRRVTYEFLINQGYVAGTIVNNPPLPPVEAKSEGQLPIDGTTEPVGDDTPAAQPSEESLPADEPKAEPATEAPASSEGDAEAEPSDAPKTDAE